MLLHNGRLADPRDPYVRQIKRLTSKKQKTLEDLDEIMFNEARASAYETPSGHLGLPTANVWRCLWDASKLNRLGTKVKMGVIYEMGEVSPLKINGKIVNVDTYTGNEDHIFSSIVVVQRVRTTRSRCLVHPGWKSTHEFEILDDVLNVDQLNPTFSRMGRLMGIGDWRPLYGQFSLAVREI